MPVEIKRPFLNGLKHAVKIIQSAELERDMIILEEEGLLGNDEPEEEDKRRLEFDKGQVTAVLDKNRNGEHTPVAIKEVETDGVKLSRQSAPKVKDERREVVKVENHELTGFSEQFDEVVKEKRTGNHNNDSTSDSDVEITGMNLF